MGYRATFDRLRSFGVEIEVIGLDSKKICRILNQAGVYTEAVEYSKKVYTVWRVSRDSSIEGGYHPTAEVISPILCGEEGLAEVSRVMTALGLGGCYVNKSCGFHVHWNCQDYTGKNVLSLLRLYAKFERVIDYLVSPSRRGNHNRHCLSLVKDNDLTWVTELDKTERAKASDIAVSFATNRSREVYTDPLTGETEERGGRYHKVNITSYLSYGTIEFRQHQGTLSGEKAANWIIFTQQLVNKAKEVTVSREVSAKPTLGEMLRVLKVADHTLIDNQCVDPLILGLGKWLKKRYTSFREGMADE